MTGKERLEKARAERAEILRICDEPGITWLERRRLLKEKGFAEILVDELVGKEEPASDY